MFIIVLNCIYFAEAQVLTRQLQKVDLERMGIRTANTNRTAAHIDMPPIDTEKLMCEDREMESEDVPFRFGYGFDTSFSLEQGKWEAVEGGRLWSLAIMSKGARSLNFIFDDFYLPQGAFLYIISNTEDVVYGPVISDNIHNKDNFLTDIICDSLVTIYLFEPSYNIGESTLTIKKVVHGYKEYYINDDYGDVNASAPCNVPVEQGFPTYEKEANAIALVLLGGGTSLCSGSLVMTTDYSFKPYLLTAFHCINTDGVLNNYTYDKSISSSEEADVNNWLIKFGFREQSDYAITFNGASFLAGWYDSDFALVELFENVKKFSHLTWLGWDRTGSTPLSGVGLHHPYGDYMKISIDNDASLSSLWEDDDFPDNVTYHWLEHWDAGITQGGSSGSPLIDQNKRVVGQLHGKIFENGHNQNTPPCLTNYTSYGKFNISWVGNGNSTGRLSNWLDPIGTGVTTMDSFKPFSLEGGSVLCGSKAYSIANLPIGATVSWSLVGGNTSCVSLQSDSPSANQCTLTLNNASGFNTVTLQADVIMNGVTVKSLQKVISKPLPFSGTYEETSILYNGSFTPSIPLTAIPGSREMDVYVGGLVKVKSDYFSGKSISISGPYTNYYRSGSLVRFTLSSWSGAPVVITVQAEGCDDEVQLKFFPAVMLDDYSLNISPDGNSTYALSLIRKTEDGVLPETSSAADDCAAPRLFSKPWTLEVTNALTGRKAFSKEVAEPSFLLHTDGWEAGVYVVRALVGDASLAGKITVK